MEPDDEAWEARLAGDALGAQERYDAVQELAGIRGFKYLDIDAVTRLPIEEVVQRVASVPEIAGSPDRVQATALLGTAEKPKINVQAALEMY